MREDAILHHVGSHARLTKGARKVAVGLCIYTDAERVTVK